MKEEQDLLRARADRAETRAAISLGAAGVFVGLVVGTFGLLRDSASGWWIVAAVLAGALVLLLKAAHYALRALDALKGNELSPEAGLELADMSKMEAQRTELAARIWECYQLLPITNERLYYAQRGLKNLGFAIVMWAASGILVVLSNYGLLDWPFWVQMLSAAVVVILPFVLDGVQEKTSGLWTHQR